MKKGAILAAFAAALVLMCIGYAIGQKRGYSRAMEGLHPADTVTTSTSIDTLSDRDPVPDTVWIERVKVVRLPAKPANRDTVWLAEEDNEPMDTLDVEVPISRYVAHRDSLYHVEATGYDVEFRQITVYPKTVTIERTVTVEKLRTTHWGIGIQAGYGATLQDNAVRLSPYVGVGISYNIASW